MATSLSPEIKPPDVLRKELAYLLSTKRPEDRLWMLAYAEQELIRRADLGRLRAVREARRQLEREAHLKA